MTFIWPTLLWLLFLVPVLVGAYLLAQRLRKKYALRYASVSLVREAVGRGPGVRRHIPAAIFLAAVALLILALARPAAIVTLPSQESTIVLTIDVSGSMRATTWSRTGWRRPGRRPARSSRSSAGASASGW